MSLLAISDLHVRYAENRRVVEGLYPRSADDWLLVAGDVGELSTDVAWALSLLRDRFHTVVWVPGNHELWTAPDDPVQARGVRRYEYLVELCRELGVVTPEDPYPVWDGPGGPVAVAPLFLLYDYTFRPVGTSNEQEALAVAHREGVVCTDEFMLHPDPYPGHGDPSCPSSFRTPQPAQTRNPATASTPRLRDEHDGHDLHRRSPRAFP